MERLDGLDGGTQWFRETDRICSSCARKGHHRKLQAFQLNFSEAVYMCSDAECLFPLDEKSLDCIVVKRKLDINNIGGNVKRKKRKRVSSDRIPFTAVTANCVSNEYTEVHEGQTNAVVNQPASDLQLTSGNRETDIKFVAQQRALPSHGTFQSDVKTPSTSSFILPVVTSGYMTQAGSCNVNLSSTSRIALNVTASAVPGTNIKLPLAQSHSILPSMMPPQNGIGLMNNRLLHCQDAIQGKLLFKANSDEQFVNQTMEQLKRPNWRQEHLQFSSVKHINELAVEGNLSKSNSVNASGDGKEAAGESKGVSKLSKSRDELPSVLTDSLFLHWTNSDAMCWLDVAMAMIVHCQSLRRAVAHDSNKEYSSCVRRLLREYDRAQIDFRRSSKLNRCHYLCGQGKMVKLETSVGHITVKTGGGGNGDGLQLGALVNPAEHVATIDVDDLSEIVCDSNLNTTSVERVSQVARRLDEQAKQILVDIREHVFGVLQETMQCKRGQNDSALLALSALLSEDICISEQFLVKYTFSLKCSKCSHMEMNRVDKDVPTFMKLPEDFAMTHPSFLRTCFSCRHPDQVLQINFDKLPEAFYCHFLYGVVHSDVTKYDFVSGGRHFFVTGVVQYCTKPSHFVCHFRQLDDNLWMTYDDLKPSAVCRFRQQVPAVPPSEVHLLLWESRPATTSIVDLPIEPPTVTSSSSPLVPLIVQSSSSVSSPVSSVEQRVPIPSAVHSSAPVRTTSSAPPRLPLTGAHQSVAPQMFVGPTPPSVKSEDRLQRARERFLRDKQGVFGSAVGTVIPSPAFSASNVGTGPGPGPGPGTVVKSYGASMRTAAEGARASYSHRKRFQPPCSLALTRAAMPAVRERLPAMTTPWLRTAFNNPYGSVLPLLHKRNSGFGAGSPTFTGYVPKAKQTTTTERSEVQNTTSAPVNVVSINVVSTASEQIQDENRRPKVCFALPGKANSSANKSNNRGIASSVDIIRKGIMSYQPDSAIISSSANDRTQSTEVVSSATVSRSDGLSTDAFQMTPDVLWVSGGMSNCASGSLADAATTDARHHMSLAAAPTSSIGDSSLLYDEGVQRMADPLTDNVDDWLFDEIYSSDSFKNDGLCPENVREDLLLSVESESQPNGSTGVSSSCDIFNGDSSNFDNGDLSMPEPVTQFTFDDMLFYLYN